MGYSYGTNPDTGRLVLACDFCGNCPARKVRCPYGYCPAVATCADCRQAGKLKTDYHKLNCKDAHAQFEAKRLERENNPRTVTVAAWGDWLTHMPGRIMVVTGSGDYFLVDKEVYDERDPNGNNFIDIRYQAITTELADILHQAEYGYANSTKSKELA